MKRQKILVTGGTGYIGSHTVVELLNAEFDVVIFDNFSNSSILVVDRIERISGRRPQLVVGDVRDKQALQTVFSEYKFDAVLHFAGLKAVGESVLQPLKYYSNNVEGALNLLSVMADKKCHRIVFSSSTRRIPNPNETKNQIDKSIARYLRLVFQYALWFLFSMGRGLYWKVI